MGTKRKSSPEPDGRSAVLQLLSNEAEVGSNPDVIRLDKQSIILGRSTAVNTCDAIINVKPSPSRHSRLGVIDNIISRRHAQILRVLESPSCKYEGNPQWKWVVKDLGSINGVFVNGYKVLEEDLHDGDEIQLGGAAMLNVGDRFQGNLAAIVYRFRIIENTNASRPQTVKTPKRQRSSSPTTSVQSAQSASRFAVVPSSVMAPPSSDSRALINTSNLRRGGEVDLEEAVHNAEERARDSEEKVNKSEARCRMLEANNIAVQAALVEAQRDIATLKAARDGQQSAADIAKAQAEKVAQAEKQLRRQLAESLFSEATCAMCQKLLLDATILPCLHTMCLTCWNKQAQSSAACPLCECPCGPGTGRAGRLCTSLDQVVGKLVDTLGSKQQKAEYEKRASVRTKTVPGAVEEVNWEAGSSQSQPLQQAAAASLIELSSRKQHTYTTNGYAHSNSKSGSRRGQQREESQEGFDPDGGVSTIRCQGCNEFGHREAECPHRSDDAREMENGLERPQSDSEDGF